MKINKRLELIFAKDYADSLIQKNKKLSKEYGKEYDDDFKFINDELLKLLKSVNK